MGSARGAGSRLLGSLSNAVARGATEALRALNLGALAGRPIEEIMIPPRCSYNAARLQRHYVTSLSARQFCSDPKPRTSGPLSSFAFVSQTIDHDREEDDKAPDHGIGVRVGSRHHKTVLDAHND
jgi:hypothetical protein